MIYVGASVLAGLTLPRIEDAYLKSYSLSLSVASAQAYLSAVASGMMALTGIVFAMAFVMVQFSAIAYSPRLVLWFARDRTLFHALGVFSATFVYALSALAWIDRGASGSVPLVSPLVVAIMLVLSMVLFAQLVQRLSDLQVTNVLHLIGDRGREVIHSMFERLGENGSAGEKSAARANEFARLGPPTQTLRYSGPPRTIARFNIDALLQLAQRQQAVIVMACGVGDTLVDGTDLLHVHGTEMPLSESALIRAIHLEKDRTFEQDPKYPIRLLVDIAIKALSPAINDPTTAVQTIDQIEDLLRRLGGRELEAGYNRDANGDLRLVFPMPTWEDYLTLAFDEIRQYGATSVQVMRRLRSALADLAESLPNAERADATRQFLGRLDLFIDRSLLDPADRLLARQQDRQGLGLSRRATEPKNLLPIESRSTRT
jgi:uncharacterized membrane protein